VALALGAREGETVLDACAGRGNKTAILARAVGPSGAVDAADSHPKKLDQLRRELARLDLSVRRTFAVDWSVGDGGIEARYDRVLVDAPCSGTGTLRRRPEIALRRDWADLAALTALQTAIATRTAGLLKPGGTMVYAVCSVLREEAEEVTGRVMAARPGLELEHARRLLPQADGTDGYFIAVLVNKAGLP
jgi:16S rRNA (cytosine967-C5)-methyltransferase